MFTYIYVYLYINMSIFINMFIYMYNFFFFDSFRLKKEIENGVYSVTEKENGEVHSKDRKRESGLTKENGRQST